MVKWAPSVSAMLQPGRHYQCVGKRRERQHINCLTIIFVRNPKTQIIVISFQPLLQKTCVDPIIRPSALFTSDALFRRTIMPGPTDNTKPVKIGAWRFWYDELDYYFVLLPAANRSDQDKEIFTVVNALCCLRERYPDTYDQMRRADVEAALEALKEEAEGRPYVARWNDAGPNSSEQQKACQQFRDHHKMLVEDWKNQQKGLEKKFVKNHEDLVDVHKFPTTALTICALV